MARQIRKHSSWDPTKLRECLQRIIPKIRECRGRNINEQNTKAMFIDPVLIALGWDIHDCDEVHREYRPQGADRPVDYALMIMREPKLLLEAKGLDEDLSNHQWVAQILGYATVAGVEWCVLSNGGEWRFYNSIATVHAEEKMFRKITLDENDLEDSFNMLALLSCDNLASNLLAPLWTAHFVDRRVKNALRELLETRDGGLVGKIRRKAPGLTPNQIKESLGRLQVQISLPSVFPAAVPTVQRTVAIGGTKHGNRLGQGKLSLRDLISAGALKPPVRLFRRYKNKMLEATLLADGRIKFKGQRYNSPGAAAKAACESVAGCERAVNGWTFWHVQDEQGNRRTLDDVRNSL